MIRMKLLRALQKRRLPLRKAGIRYTAVNRACRRALFPFEKTHALAALVGRDVIDVLAERRMLFAGESPLLSAPVNCVVGTHRHASAAIDALFRNQRRHENLAAALLEAGAPNDAAHPGGVRVSAPAHAGKGQTAPVQLILGHRGQHATRQVHEGAACGMLGVLQYDRHPGVARLAHLEMDRDLSQQPRALVHRELRAAARAK